uniref:hypothetical protein n=1 Tax=Massilia sp. TWP1-3-3 TaxID=2804573 RepID=UPI003CF41911
LVGAHGHDDGALLSSQMFVDFCHGGTLQQKVLHLVFENAHGTAEGARLSLLPHQVVFLRRKYNYVALP